MRIEPARLFLAKVRRWLLLFAAILFLALWASAPSLLAHHYPSTPTVALAYQVQEPTNTPSPTPTSTATPTSTTDSPDTTPTPIPTPIPVYIDSVVGRFFFNPGPQGTPIFLVGTATPPVFTQSFPVIDFDPPDHTGLGCTTNVDGGTRPFTDVMPGSGTPGTPCATIVAQDGSPTPTYQAGVAPLVNFHALYTGHIQIPDGVPVPVM